VALLDKLWILNLIHRPTLHNTGKAVGLHINLKTTENSSQIFLSVFTHQLAQYLTSYDHLLPNVCSHSFFSAILIIH
jgi:hypothetical protein